jgi:predicted transcriptional regulator
MREFIRIKTMNDDEFSYHKSCGLSFDEFIDASDSLVKKGILKKLGYNKYGFTALGKLFRKSFMNSSFEN